MNEHAWTLVASNGYTRLTCTRSKADASELLFDVRLEYGLPIGPEPAAIAEIAQVGLRRSAIEELITAIATFVTQPLSGLNPENFDYTADVADSAGDHLVLSFGPRPEVVTGSTGIACAVELRRSMFSAKVAFRTDVTCLDLLAQGLESTSR